MCCCPTRATCFTRETLVFLDALSDVSRSVLTVISNENREQLHRTPEANTRTPEVATLATLLLPINWRVLVLPSWDNTSYGSWCSAVMFTLLELTRVTQVILPNMPMATKYFSGGFIFILLAKPGIYEIWI